MQVVEEQIVEKIRTLTDGERADVFRYVDGVLSKHKPDTSLVEKLLALSSQVPDEVWDRIPADGSEQHDHYIYGTKKR